LNKVEFENFTSKIGMFLTTQQVTTLFNTFDANRDKRIHYKEFIDALRTDFNEKRLATVKYAFEVLSS